MQESPVSRITSPDACEKATAGPSEDGKQRMRQLVSHCQNFKGADAKRSIIQLTTNLVGYFGLCTLMLYSFIHESYALAFVLMVLAAGFLVRLFIIQHDCGHGSFFNSRRANDMVGRCISILTITPYDFWRQAHAMHHASSGNLNRRGIGSLDTLTVREYEALPEQQRRVYRLYRNPFSQLILCPILYIFIIQRFPPSQSLPFLKEYHSMPLSQSWRSIIGLDVAMLVCFGLMGMLIGWGPLFLCYIPVVVITSWIGGWLFFIQHQFEDAYWNHDKDWNFHEAAVLGSTYYVLPPLLQWFTGNIGIHHIHHLCSMIPNYKLQSCLDGSEVLQGINRLTLWQSFKCLRWALWDETQRKMVAFCDLENKHAMSAAA
jgi:acyl-lipid omega-6 desaturase (Delta-12 desaturase)